MKEFRQQQKRQQQQQSHQQQQKEEETCIQQSGTMSTDDGKMANASDMEKRVQTETEEKEDANGSFEMANEGGINDRVWSLWFKVDKVINRFVPMKDYIEQNGRWFLDGPLGKQ